MLINKWWEVHKSMKPIESIKLCECKTEQKGRWIIVNPHTLERAYVCEKCKRKIYPNK